MIKSIKSPLESNINGMDIQKRNKIGSPGRESFKSSSQ